jgi:hypothetical protein
MPLFTHFTCPRWRRFKHPFADRVAVRFAIYVGEPVAEFVDLRQRECFGDAYTDQIDDFNAH